MSSRTCCVTVPELSMANRFDAVNDATRAGGLSMSEPRVGVIDADMDPLSLLLPHAVSSSANIEAVAGQYLDIDAPRNLVSR
jgi:hypothetical protein